MCVLPTSRRHDLDPKASGMASREKASVDCYAAAVGPAAINNPGTFPKGPRTQITGF